MALPASIAAARSWFEFAAAVDALEDTTAKGDAFEQLVAQHLRYDPKYRTKLVHVWRHHEVPAELRARLRLPGRDMGIDLVAETHTGEFWAIQAKYRAATAGTVTFGELSTFSSLAFHVCAGAFAYALVCTTTERITATLTGLNNLGTETAETWAALPADFFAYLSAPTATPPPPLTPRPPRPHQTQAVERAVAYFATPGQTRGKLIHPCGAGKSLTAYWIARALEANRVLIAVPSLALVRQTLETWMSEALADGRAADWLCVCSDDEIASDFDNEELVARIHELGLPCDTDPAELEKHLRAAAARPGLLVVLTTYQSSPVLAQAARAAGTAFDLCVCDEAHKTTGAASSYYAHLLHDENLPLARRLFMTATERRFASSRSDDIVSMDDPDLYGETIDLLTFKAAIAAEPPILCDYRLLTIGVRESEVRALVEENRWLDLGPDGLDEVTSLALASLVALRRATTQYGVRHTVSFHSSILRAARFRELNNRLNDHLPNAAPVRAFHVTGKMGSAARARELERFMQVEPSLVTNARCLTEGVDVPGIDCVFFADPKGSTIDIVQASGRALRLAKGKQLGYILLPLVVPDGATPDDIAESTGFKFVLSVLRALAAQDDRIIDWFRAKQDGESSDVGALFEVDLREIVSATVDADRFCQEIEIKCWEQVARLSFRPYHHAREWARSLEADGVREWWQKRRELALSGKWPADIPADAYNRYVGKGWVSWGDFLGTGRVATFDMVFVPYERAREWARSLNLCSSKEWQDYSAGRRPDLPKRPTDVPASPDTTYENAGWVSWADFLDSERFRIKYASYAEASQWGIANGIKTGDEWATFPDRPENIPASPDKFYATDGWLGWGDFLGTGRIANYLRVLWPYEKAREFAHQLNLRTSPEWKDYCDGKRPDLPPRPPEVPYSPFKSYQGKGWVSWDAFLAPRWRDYPLARDFAHSLKLSGQQHWKAYVAGKRSDLPPLPEDIPKAPEAAYRREGGWVSWGDWLGHGITAGVKRVYLPFTEAREIARSLGLTSVRAWHALTKDKTRFPVSLPVSPHEHYAMTGWISWSDWLGCDVKEPAKRKPRVLGPRFRSFADAREFARALQLGGSLNWPRYVRGEFSDKPPKPSDIPASPKNAYAADWQGWGDFLGSGNVAPKDRVFRPFEEARAYVRTLGFRTGEEYRAWHKATRPADLPSSPNNTYAGEGFVDWQDFLQAPGAGNDTAPPTA